MEKSLLIVESPAKAKTIKKYVGDGFEVLASKGHIKDLPKRGGVDIENGFQETYEVLEEKGKDEVVKEIRASAKKATRILLATDPDREGEAIAFHLMEVVQSANKTAPVERVLFNEITKKGVQEGLAHPRALDTSLYEAQRTRRVLDRIGGYPLSNLLWTKLTYGLSAGRVQTPALRIIVDRQKEHDSFVPQNYWLLEAQLTTGVLPQFVGSLFEANGEKLERVGSRPAATSEPQASKLVADLKKATYVVSKVQKRETRRRAPAPYTTSKLQMDASNRISMGPKRTMRIAQQLYEGVTIGKGKNAELVGLLTYIRTDSTRLSADAILEVRDHIEKTYGKASVPDVPNEWKAKGNSNVQDAHEAIRPTRLDLPPSEVSQYLTPEQQKLYQLVWDRFIACQMTPAVYDQTSAEIVASTEDRKHLLRASGSVLKVAGWKAVYGAGVAELAGEEAEGSSDDEGTLLPVLTEGMTLTLGEAGAKSVHKQTEPPPLFSEASLVKKLEEEGIGRPSTYSEIVSKVQARDYVKNEKGRLVATELGKLVIEKLVLEGFDLADVGFTRKLEEELDAVSESRAKRLDILAPFHDRLTKQIEVAKSHKGKWWPEAEDIGEKCPECGTGDLQKRWGKNGPFVGCPNYPECKFTRHIAGPGEESRQPELTDYTCTECGSKMMKRWGRNGFFLGCSGYPKCKSTRPVPLGIHCPLCKTGDIIEIKGRGRGRSFYGCTNYSSDPKCEFRLWQKPVIEDCPQCGNGFLVRGGTKNSPLYKCGSPTCSFERAIGDEEPEPGEGEAPPRDLASNE